MQAKKIAGAHLLHEEDEQEADDDDGEAHGEVGVELGHRLVLVHVGDEVQHADGQEDRAGERVEAGQDALQPPSSFSTKPS